MKVFLLVTSFAPLVNTLSLFPNTFCGSRYHGESILKKPDISSRCNKSALFVVSPPSSTAASVSSADKRIQPFANFDYESHWYPVSWSCDLELNEPTKITVFDVDYVVAKTSDNEVTAMKNICPHKAAALSEGRITSAGYFQCAYHGWSFDGKSGKCVEIPQIIRDRSEGASGATIPARASSDAVPAQIHQGVVWLFPGGGIEKALCAPPPPTIPEFDQFKLTSTVRDMPVDFPILLSNICDPDHGLFAHQSKGFDLYTSSLDCPFESFESEEKDDGKGWTLTSKVDAKNKLLEVDAKLRKQLDPKKMSGRDKKKQSSDIPWATFEFHAPNHVIMKRINKESGETKFISIFYVCPVGVGRSRFMGGTLSALALPRWVNHIVVNNFLDQDTYLLATQQTNILNQEAKELRSIMEEEGISRAEIDKIRKIRMTTRRKLFCLPSPTEKIGSKIEQFWDETLARVPNRVQTLLKLDDANAFAVTPSRSFVLDRKAQTTDISKDSRDFVVGCQRVQKGTNIVALALVLAKIASLSNCAILRFASVLKPGAKTSLVLAMSLFLSTIAAKKAEKEFYFKYTDSMRRSDMNKIPNEIWLDKE